MAKTNYAFAKRQRDLAKKQRKEAKLQKKLEPVEAPPAPATDDQSVPVDKIESK